LSRDATSGRTSCPHGLECFPVWDSTPDLKNRPRPIGTSIKPVFATLLERANILVLALFGIPREANRLAPRQMMCLVDLFGQYSLRQHVLSISAARRSRTSVNLHV
jgi:hypothetical protein